MVNYRKTALSTICIDIGLAVHFRQVLWSNLFYRVPFPQQSSDGLIGQKKILPYDSDSVYMLGVQKCRSKNDGVYGTFCISWPSNILTTSISQFCPPLTSSKLDQCLFLTLTFDFVSCNITLGQDMDPDSTFPLQGVRNIIRGRSPSPSTRSSFRNHASLPPDIDKIHLQTTT